MSEIKSIERMRKFIDDQFGVGGFAYSQGMAIADNIEAEIAANYMRLPCDVDGVPIRVGDNVAWIGPNSVYEVSGVGKLVSLRIHDSNCFTIEPGCLRNVKPQAVMTSADELREAARQFEGYQNGEISRMMREAAYTIESLHICETGKRFELSCGHSFILDGFEVPICCPICGKVVE